MAGRADRRELESLHASSGFASTSLSSTSSSTQGPWKRERPTPIAIPENNVVRAATQNPWSGADFNNLDKKPRPRTRVSRTNPQTLIQFHEVLRPPSLASSHRAGGQFKRPKLNNSSNTESRHASRSNRLSLPERTRHTIDTSTTEQLSDSEVHETAQGNSSIIEIPSDDDEDTWEPVRETKSSSPDPLSLIPRTPVRPKPLSSPARPESQSQKKGKDKADQAYDSDDIESIQSTGSLYDSGSNYPSNARTPIGGIQSGNTDRLVKVFDLNPTQPKQPRNVDFLAMTSSSGPRQPILNGMKKREERTDVKPVVEIRPNDRLSTSSNFLENQDRYESPVDFPLEYLSFGTKIHHRKVDFAELSFTWSEESRTLSVKCSPDEEVPFQMDQDFHYFIVTNSDNLKVHDFVLLQFQTAKRRRWRPTSSSKHFQPGSGGEDGKLTFILGRFFVMTEYQKLVTFLEKILKGKTVDPENARKVWQTACAAADMRGLEESRNSSFSSQDHPARILTYGTRSKKEQSRQPSPSEPARRSSRQATIQSRKSSPKAEPDELILMYPPSGTGALNIMKSDLARLGPSEFLNDTLIEFGLKLWLSELREKNKALADDIHIFSSFFYKKLHNRKDSTEGYQSVRKWTAKFDLFSKKYVIVPINENLHWYLAVIFEPEHVLRPPLPKPPVVSSVSTRGKKRRLQEEETADANEEAETPQEIPTEETNAGSRISSLPRMETESAQSTDLPERLPSSRVEDTDMAESISPSRQASPLRLSNEESTQATCGSTPNPEDVEMNNNLVVDEPHPSTSMDAQISESTTPLERPNTPTSLMSLVYPSSSPEIMDVDDEELPNKPQPPKLSQSRSPISQPREDSPVLELGMPRSDTVPNTSFYASGPANKGKAKEETPLNVSEDDLEDNQRQEKEVDAMLAVTPPTEQPQTRIFILDSLGTRHPQAAKVLKFYLEMEAKDKKQVEIIREPISKNAQVPIQPNFCDCGIYLLHFVQTLMKDPERFNRIMLTTRKLLSSERKSVWDEPAINALRSNLAARIMALSDDWKVERAKKEEEKRSREGTGQTGDSVDSSDDEVNIVEQDVGPEKPRDAMQPTKPKPRQTAAARLRG